MEDKAENIVEFLSKHIIYYYKDYISNVCLKIKYNLIFIMFDIHNGKIMVFFTIKHYIFGLSYPRYRLKKWIIIYPYVAGTLT